MARILVLGTGPLLESGARVMSGQCLRTWHFVFPLLQAGHEVLLLTVPIPGATDDEADPPVEDSRYRDFSYRRLLSNDPKRILPLINETIDGMQPRALIGVNAYPAYLLACLERPEPFWADLNGWTMAEGQVRAAVLGHDRDFPHFWKLEALTVLRADRFSTVTSRQADALYGELAMLGRLEHRTFSEPFATVVPNAVYPDYAELERRSYKPDFLLDKMPSNAAVCLWSGGFNSWTDVNLLAEGIARALEREPSLHFVSTGGAIHGHDEETYQRFLAAAQARFPEGRWHALGWIDFAEVLALHACADVGLNIDGVNTETRFGARNRLTNMMGAGLPVATTRGTEIAEWIEARDFGAIVSPGNADELALAIASAVSEREFHRERAARARQAVLAEFAASATLADLFQWVEHPVRAADRGQAGGMEHSPPRFVRRWALKQALADLPFLRYADEEDHHEAPRVEKKPRGLIDVIKTITGGKH